MLRKFGSAIPLLLFILIGYSQTESSPHITTPSTIQPISSLKKHTSLSYPKKKSKKRNPAPFSTITNKLKTIGKPMEIPLDKTLAILSTIVILIIAIIWINRNRLVAILSVNKKNPKPQQTKREERYSPLGRYHPRNAMDTWRKQRDEMIFKTPLGQKLKLPRDITDSLNLFTDDEIKERWKRGFDRIKKANNIYKKDKFEGFRTYVDVADILLYTIWKVEKDSKDYPCQTAWETIQREGKKWKKGIKLYKKAIEMKKQGKRMHKEGFEMWKKGFEMWKEGLKIKEEGLKIQEEGLKIEEEGWKIQEEGWKMWHEGEKIEKEGDKKWKEGGKIIKTIDKKAWTKAIEVLQNKYASLFEEEENIANWKHLKNLLNSNHLNETFPIYI